MKEIELSQGKTALVDDEDYERLQRWSWSAVKLSHKHTWYATANEGTSLCPTTVRMHRVIMNARPGEVVDHIDGNGLNNQKANLRVCEQRQNVRNAKKHRASVSRYKGVTPNRDSRKNPWRAQIQIDGKKIALGVFPTEEDAALAYNFAAWELFGEFARYNEAPQLDNPIFDEESA